MGSFHELPRDERRLIVNRGTAHYSRQLALVDNAEFGDETQLEGWTIAHLAAHVGYNAAALCNLMHWAETGEETPMYATPSARNDEIAFGSTLLPDAIRNLHDHTVARLRVAWDEAGDEAWAAQVQTAQGRTVPAEETLWMRTREVWIHAVDLGKSAGFSDIPEVVLETLLHEIPQKWRGAGAGVGLVLVDEDSGEEIEVSPPAENGRTVISGSTAALVRWASGRGATFVTSDRGEVPRPPRWL